jgi:branched-chain amino acid aminotransferase
MEAVEDGYGEAVLLNETGMVAEGSGENIFVVRDGKLSTPPLSDGVLEGLTRNSVIQIARDMGYEVAERSLVRTDLYVADEVFFTGSAAEVTPIGSVDKRTIGNGKRGPITKVLQERFFDVVAGRLPEYSSWLYMV